jgi:hypothetical protein
MSLINKIFGIGINNYEFKKNSNSMWVEPLTINGKTVEIRNYGIVMSKGYKIGFVIDGVLAKETLTASRKFERITGTQTFDDTEKLLNLYGNYMIKKFRWKIF